MTVIEQGRAGQVAASTPRAERNDWDFDIVWNSDADLSRIKRNVGALKLRRYARTVSRRGMKALIAATLAMPTVLMAPTPAEAAPRATAAIFSTPATVYVSADRSYADVKVTYKCKNTNQVRYYLDGQLDQDVVPYTYYSIGYRGVSGIVQARCTGGRVTQTLRYVRSWWWGEPEPQLQSAPAHLRFHLDARAATGAGWYQDMKPDDTVDRTVTLVTP